MKYTRYSKYVGDLADEMSLEDLLGALSDYMLESGFHSDSMYFQQMDEHSLDALRQAIQQALEMGDFLDEDMRERLEQMQAEGTMEELIERLIERMQQEELISVDQPHDPARQSTTPGQTGEAQTNARFEITDRAWTFSALRPCATCWAPWAVPASDAMTRATRPPASNPAAHPSNMNSATP